MKWFLMFLSIGLEVAIYFAFFNNNDDSEILNTLKKPSSNESKELERGLQLVVNRVREKDLQIEQMKEPAESTIQENLASEDNSEADVIDETNEEFPENEVNTEYTFTTEPEIDETILDPTIEENSREQNAGPIPDDQNIKHISDGQNTDGAMDEQNE